MFAGLDWDQAGVKPANWAYEPGATPADRFYGFSHVQDELVPSNLLPFFWQALGINIFAPTTVVEQVAGPPYAGSHMLFTDLLPRGQSMTDTNLPNYHGATVLDSAIPLDLSTQPVYRTLWEYMMAGPTRWPEVDTPAPTTSGVEVTWVGQTCLVYQVQSSSDLVSWSNRGGVVHGFPGAVSSTIPVEADAGYHRLVTFY
jgi:hypothetical protein